MRDSLIAIEPYDSDADGWINIDEIAALTFPGGSSDYPVVVCPDADGDGYTDAACGGDDCDDTDPAIITQALRKAVLMESTMTVMALLMQRILVVWKYPEIYSAEDRVHVIQQ